LRRDPYSDACPEPEAVDNDRIKASQIGEQPRDERRVIVQGAGPFSQSMNMERVGSEERGSGSVEADHFGLAASPPHGRDRVPDPLARPPRGGIHGSNDAENPHRFHDMVDVPGRMVAQCR